MPRRCWLFALVLPLVSCSRQERPTPARQAAPAQESAPDHRPVIAAFGDSLTAGYGLPQGESYPDHLQKILDGRGYRYRVVNLGVSGDTTDGGASRIEDALLLRPKIVILELGANDGLRGLPIERTKANLDLMINAFEGEGAKVVLAGMTLPRNYGKTYIRDFERVFLDLSRERRVTLIPFLLEGVATEAALMQADGLHPNAAGCRLVAARVFRSIEPLLGK